MAHHLLWVCATSARLKYGIAQVQAQLPPSPGTAAPCSRMLKLASRFWQRCRFLPECLAAPRMDVVDFAYGDTLHTLLLLSSRKAGMAADTWSTNTTLYFFPRLHVHSFISSLRWVEAWEAVAM